MLLRVEKKIILKIKAIFFYDIVVLTTLTRFFIPRYILFGRTLRDHYLKALKEVHYISSSSLIISQFQVAQLAKIPKLWSKSVIHIYVLLASKL